MKLAILSVCYGDTCELLASCPSCGSRYFISWNNKHAGCIFSGAIRPEDCEVEELPKIKDNTVIPESACRISPDFKQIYLEARMAQAAGLDLICGGGYRKALEFLIKDYAISLCPEKAEAIKERDLNYAISCTDNENIKSFASRASWLGNDALHYLKKWEGMDLFDLKDLIEQSVLSIDQDVRRRTLLAKMPKDPKK